VNLSGYDLVDETIIANQELTDTVLSEFRYNTTAV
jgi:hypothetical protein